MQSDGFRTVERPGIALSALQSLRVDFVLELGQVTETVTITSQAPQVDTRSTQIGMTVDDRRIKDLPLNGRKPSRPGAARAGRPKRQHDHPAFVRPADGCA